MCVLVVENLMLKSTKHSFHIVDPSPWPFFCSIIIFFTVLGLTGFFHKIFNGFTIMKTSLILFLVCLFSWWRDVVREATFEGSHTKSVKYGLRLGMLLFIVSEVMFFFAFFWEFFHSSLNPSPFIGGTWPPVGIKTIDPWKIPFLNTVILLTSGATITYSHYSLIMKSIKNSLNGLQVTLFLAIIFTFFQVYEYCHSPFSISDGIYGSVFFLTTGFHGFHVFVGTLFLLVNFIRMLMLHFTSAQHIGFECAIWYWHFVDVVWIFLFIFVYWWGY